MALELQSQFPNVELDAALYWIVSGNKNVKGNPIKLAFCSGELWTYRQIKEWMASYAIPLLLKNNPHIVAARPYCAEEDQGGQKTLVCSHE